MTPWGPGKIKAKQLGDAAMVEFLPGEIDSFGMYVAFSKKSKCNALKARFAEGIRKEVAEGRVQPLLDAAQKRAEQYHLFFGSSTYAERGDISHGEKGFPLFLDVVKKHTPIVQPSQCASPFHVLATPAGFDLPGDRHDPGRDASRR